MSTGNCFVLRAFESDFTVNLAQKQSGNLQNTARKLLNLVNTKMYVLILSHQILVPILEHYLQRS